MPSTEGLPAVDLNRMPPVVCHIYCCDPHRALCGADVSGLGPCGCDEDECDTCVMLDLLEVGCRAPGCPLRGDT